MKPGGQDEKKGMYMLWMLMGTLLKTAVNERCSVVLSPGKRKSSGK